MGLPVEVNNLMMGSLGGYNINRSLRFRSSASAYLNRTPASAGNRRTWTYSAWIKLGSLSTPLNLLYAYSADSDSGLCQLSYQSNQLRIQGFTASFLMVSTPVYRDPSAWYHVIYSVDTTQTTAANRVRVYVNGVEITAWSTNTPPPQNTDTAINNSVAHNIGRNTRNAADYLDGYFAEVNLIDGQALTPSSFGAYDTNGVWQPKKYTGTYGTNGFYLPFSNTTSTTTLVQDSSGNSNNWTPNNISLTAGTTYDSMIDSPTLSASASNYAVMNPLNSAIPLQNGNLRVISSSSNTVGAGATATLSNGKWYWEATITTFSGSSTNILLGINDVTKCSMITPSVSTPSPAVDFTYGYAYTASSGNIRKFGVDSAYGATYTAGDVIGIAYDAINNTITFYKNGTSQGQVTGLSALTYIPWVYYGGGSATNTVDMNFGQRPFSYTPPTGFNALNTYNLPAPSIANGAQYMAATTYTGTGASQSISNGSNTTIGTTFQPDFVWIKSRSTATDHQLFDVVRGGTPPNRLLSNSTGAELTTATGYVGATSTGFSLDNSGGGGGDTNTSPRTYVGWQWKAGGTGVTNTSGTITSTVSANPTAGFSIVTYTGTGANATVGHGLGVAPNMIIVKRRDSTGNWITYHNSLGATQYLYLNLTAAAGTNIVAWNNTSPTSSVFSIGTGTDLNVNGSTNVAYCFAAVSGYSAMGSYTGNGSSDGPFIFTNFRPRWIMIKNASGVVAWVVYDTSRNTYNSTNLVLQPNVSSAEATGVDIDVLSNGFKIRTTDQAANNSGQTYVWAAFCENPFKYSRGR